MAEYYLRCRECDEKMFGIRSYKARQVCEGCGGKNLIHNEKIKAAIKPVYTEGKQYKVMELKEKNIPKPVIFEDL